MTSPNSRYKPGDHIAVREVWQGKIWTGRPYIVVQDTPNLIALYMPHGAPWMRPAALDGRNIRSPDQDFTVAPETWRNDVLRLAVPGEDHSVWLIWKPGFVSQTSWYVNMEAPMTRTAGGFDFMDHALDIVIKPDFSSWYWKDEDDLIEMVNAGALTHQRAEALRKEGLKAIARMEARQSPFTDEWRRWRPDPFWIIPRLPEGWDKLPDALPGAGALPIP